MELKELKELYKALNVTFPDDLTLKRAIIYYRFVKDTYDSLTTGAIKQELSKIAQGYERLAPAFTQSDLLRGLCKILDEYIISALNAALTQSRKAYGAYFATMLQEYPKSVETFFLNYPQTHFAVGKLAQYFNNNILTACKRILNDWGYLQHMFATPNSLFEKLIDIESTGSDFHKGGQQVLILTFKVYPAGHHHRLVYKPSDLEIDCLITGNSQAVNKFFQPPFQEASLMEILNTLIKQDTTYKLPPFPIYKILPMYAGSRLRPDGTGKLPIRDSYGYIEYLAHEEPLNPFAFERSDFRIFPVQNREAICTGFYTLLGQLSAIAAIFSLSDLHMQNLIVHTYLPYLIDLENSLIEPINELSDTHLMGGWQSGGAIDGVVVTFDDIDKATLNDSSKSIELKIHHKYGQNRLWEFPNRMISPGEFGDTICRSFGSTMTLIHKCLQAGNNPFANWFARLKQGAIVRFVPLGTQDFQVVIKKAFNGDVNKDEYVKKQMKSFLEGKYDTWNKNQTLEPKFLCLQEGYVVADMLQLDVPIFYHQLNTLNVLDSHGTVIDVPQSITIKGASINIQSLLNRSTFFPTLPLDHVCSVQLLTLSDPGTLEARIGKFMTSLKRYALQTAQDVATYQAFVRKQS